MKDYESRLNSAVNNLNQIESVVAHYLTSQDNAEVRINNPFKHTNIR